ncbi:6-hydroxymethylpterin diphosphokinase MptE-like protein [Arcicella rigui]|uniref:6-hydroxymethylpterin diphosphokinase MptE-like protein n=1 Tax=Arcicella rigui TaxID=797020 RepID=A0ABU5Q8X0_9BACT|nr:6-hydroxymethylpterin diphosphokinase MptE-like protein [Arcicella rigui]MEA5139286.1 6-hydroxymethylpterin diphosphokinase MptE-like protein [Arcicella rigui]
MKNEMIDIDPILKVNPVLNPYKHAGKLVYERLLWDLNPESWRSRKKLKDSKNKFKGQKVVILCNGPSLNKVDFDLLKNIPTIGLNKVNLLFDRTSFRPTMIAAVNGLVVEQNLDFYNSTEIPLFISSNSSKIVTSRENVSFLHGSYQQKFSEDVSMSIWEGGTVTFVAMQLAFHLGFQNVALVGCDHYFSAKGAPGQLAVSKEKDDSHFDPRYFSNGMQWQLPEISTSEYSYNIANQKYLAHGRKIFNATDGGALEIFERIKIEDFLKK